MEMLKDLRVEIQEDMDHLVITTPLGMIAEAIETERGNTTGEMNDGGRDHLIDEGENQKWTPIPPAEIIELESEKTATQDRTHAMKGRLVGGIGTEGEVIVMTVACQGEMHDATTSIDHLGETETYSPIAWIEDLGEVGGIGGSPKMIVTTRKKSPTPPPRKKEPTPDLTDIESVLDRKRRLTQWDIKPPGYENVTAEQAKLSGMFPLPGAPRQQPMDPSKLQAFMNQPSGGAGSAALKPSNARQSKRLFVSNLPSLGKEEALINFFNVQLNGLNVISSTDPCIMAQVAKDTSFALLEFKSPNEATVALALDGIALDDGDAMDMNGSANGASQGLQIKRPKDYIVPSAAEDQDYQEGEVSSLVPDTPNKISVTNLLPNLADEQVTELLVAFGQLKAFVLVKDASTGDSRGIAFCEYVDPAVTDIAVEGLNGMELGEKHLKVARASIGFAQAAGLEMGVSAMSMLAGTTSDTLDEGRVLQLLNMVTPEELMDGEEYEEICEDIKEECEKYGAVLEMKVPRPSGGSRQSNGVGKIYVKYDTPESARKALQALAGRKFADRTVVTTYFSEESFEVNAW
ncbi:uncharacterized protein KY384_008469 [Bacidia gigantensis]|uniref:uncharacterized protein n=1 Tax=Bacidia gigantensis TaxID=2732470 RepID=UPI001D049F35|nr:uncharacterized protein KY384_008469 [Bacidia gigantensis]KAG8527040.1 hypothetical protein KY384_008469 [Bacidia gigantensis]